MRAGRILWGCCVGVLAVLLLAACGARTGSAPSAADPAQAAPASALLYVDLVVRPQGTQRASIEQALHKLFGAGADGTVARGVEEALKPLGLSYASGVQPWLGRRIGVVVTAPDRTGIGIIAATSDPAAARSFVTRLLARRRPGLTGRVEGHWVVLGGAGAVRAILATTSATSLASSPRFTAAMAQLAPDAVMHLWGNPRALLQPLLQQSHAGAMLSQALSRVPQGAAVTAGLTVSPAAIALDLVSSGLRTASGGTPADVSGLPGSSWLALATGGLSRTQIAGYERSLQAAMRRQIATLGAAASSSPFAGMLIARFSSLERMLLPALGPVTLSLSGSSPLALTAGLTLRPLDLSALNRLLARVPGLAGGHGGTVTLPTGQRISVTEPGGQVIATTGYPSPAAFLHPASTLASNPLFRQALAQLPVGSHAALFVSFAPLEGLAALAGQSRSAASGRRVLRALKYLVLGGIGGHHGLVLGLN